MVGAVIVDEDDRVLSEGAHGGVGLPHAETIALDRAGERASGATMVVTLEPCVHHGRTPPCADAVIAAGIGRVVVGALDPDERVSGRGVERLRSAGLEVVVVPEFGAAVEDMDHGYFHHRRTGLPSVTLKSAITIDGQTAAVDGSSQWITGDAARIDAHRLRASHDSVLIGAGTLRADDPRLDVRLDDYNGPQPRPIVIAGRESLPADRALWKRDPLIIAPPGTVTAVGELIEVPEGPGGVDLTVALRQIADRGYLSLLLEGGSKLSSALWSSGLIQRGVTYMAGAVAGGQGIGMFADSFPSMRYLKRVTITGVTSIDGDLRIDWRL